MNEGNAVQREALNWNDPKIRAAITAHRKTAIRRLGRGWSNKHDLSVVRQLFKKGLIDAAEYENYVEETRTQIAEQRKRDGIHPKQTDFRVY